LRGGTGCTGAATMATFFIAGPAWREETGNGASFIAKPYHATPAVETIHRDRRRNLGIVASRKLLPT